jgi:RNA polymerase sigma-70 factor (ECF subfamily)
MPSAFDVPVADETLAGARRGDRAAQESLYRMFEGAVFSLARRMTGDPDAAKDVMQDAFMKAFGRFHQFRGEAPFGLWLRSIAASEALMHLRRGRYFLDLFTTDETVLQSVGREDVSDIDLERALGLLPSVPRSVLWLYHVEGYTHAEIAAMCGKTVSFSKSQLSRAHQKLRTLLGGEPQSTQGMQLCSAELAKTI